MDQQQWEALHKLIYQELKEVRVELTKIKVEIAMLKVKSGVWGSAGAILVLLPSLIVYLITK